jgi:hypothetical protein
VTAAIHRLSFKSGHDRSLAMGCRVDDLRHRPIHSRNKLCMGGMS